MTSTWTLGYMSVAAFPGFDSVGLDLYRSIRTVESDDGDEEYLSVGGEVSFDYPIADYTDASISYKHEDESVVGSSDWSSIDSLGFGIVYDDVDDPYFPTSGNRQVASVEKAGGFAAGEQYTKLELTWIEYTPVRSILFGDLNQALALRMMLGWADEGLPVTQAFYLGGPTSVRGTEATSVSRMFISNFEYRVELTEGLELATFFDAALNLDSVCAETSLASTGFQFGITAVGLYVRLEFAWVLGRDMTWFPVFDIGFGPMF
jgi:outer membrane protein assembly factor BamA